MLGESPARVGGFCSQHGAVTSDHLEKGIQTMNDRFILEGLFADSDRTTTIRLGDAADAADIDRLAALDERDPGESPHLVADDDGEIVAALSLTDGTAIGDPFRLTLPTIGLLRARARQLDALGRGRRGRRLAAMLASRATKGTIMDRVSSARRSTRLGLAALAALACLGLAGTSTSQAAPKRGFLPGTWNGTGTISGSAVDGPITTHFGGGIAFTIRVDRKLRVSGTGTWRMDMLGSSDGPSDSAVDSSMQGSAAIRMGGSASGVTFSGTQKVVGEVRMGGVARAISFDRPLAGRLVITRAGTCKVVGRSALQSGVTLTWTAVMKGSGTCRT